MQNTHDIKIDSKAIEALKSFKLPEDLSFGKVLAPVMVVCEYDNGKWEQPELLPYQKLEIDPTCKVLHYAQEIFEGMKAYKVEGKGPFHFRPDENLERFNLSARRMAMPEVPKDIFMNSVEAMTSHMAGFIPGQSGDSLYLRPFMFATDNGLGIKPSDSFKFLVVASPSSAYFKTGSVSVYIERNAVRACPGGVGAAKTGGNYAASLLSMIEANDKGYDQVLWLDAVNKSLIEEMSGMNMFAVINDVLVTPALTQTILNGITRKSIVKLAEHLNIKLEERELTISELTEKIKSGECTEAFACGTAVIITPINCFGEADGTKHKLQYSEGPIATKLRQGLLDIQEGRAEDPFSWRIPVEPAQF